MDGRKESLTNLARPRAEVEQKLKSRIEEGERLLALDIESLEDLTSAAIEYSRWSEYNGELLRRLFTDTRMAEEYGGGSLYGASTEDVGLHEAAPQLYGYIEAETQRLRSILKRTELMSEDVSRKGVSTSMSSGAEGQAGPDPRIVFVVHGRNMAARNAMFQFLRAIGLRPREWSQAVEDTGKATPYIGEVLEAAFSKAQAVVVLLTPDDEARLRESYRSAQDPPYEKELTPQARPNVLFEAGMAMGRSPDRTVLVEVGDVRPFSDIAGRHVVRLNNSSERRQELAQRLRRSGCDVDLVGTDWHREGDFSVETAGSSQTNAAERMPGRATPRSGQQDALAHESYSSLVLMLPPGEAPLFVESLRVESGEVIKMTLSPADNRQAAVLDGLSRTASRSPLPVAFGSKALYGRVSEVKHVFEGGREVWNVEMVPDDTGHNWGMNYSGFPEEQVAEMRARRILLNEKLPEAGSRYRNPNNLNAMLLEKTVAGGGKTFEIPHSPFPALYEVAKSDIDEFLAAARLFAVLELLLTETVERIHTLDLTMQGDDKLEVRFEGQRRKEYADRPPHVIKVEGVCDLSSN